MLLNDEVRFSFWLRSMIINAKLDVCKQTFQDHKSTTNSRLSLRLAVAMLWFCVTRPLNSLPSPIHPLILNQPIRCHTATPTQHYQYRIKPSPPQTSTSGCNIVTTMADSAHLVMFPLAAVTPDEPTTLGSPSLGLLSIGLDAFHTARTRTRNRTYASENSFVK